MLEIASDELLFVVAVALGVDALAYNHSLWTSPADGNKPVVCSALEIVAGPLHKLVS